MQFKPTGGLSNNSILEGDGFFISFLPANNGLNQLMPGFASDDGSDETAIIKDGNYYILNGDFREQYLMLVPHGFEKCLAFYNENINKQSSWADVRTNDATS